MTKTDAVQAFSNAQSYGAQVVTSLGKLQYKPGVMDPDEREAMQALATSIQYLALGLKHLARS